MATQQQHTPRGEITGEHRITSAEIDTEIDRLRNTANHITHRRLEQPRTCPETRDSVLDQLLEGMRGIQDLSRLENASHDYPLRETRNYAFDVTYGRIMEDVKNQHDPVNTYIKVEDDRDMIPEIDRTSRNQVQKFLNASTYAMSEINPADERSLL